MKVCPSFWVPSWGFIHRTQDSGERLMSAVSCWSALLFCGTICDRVITCRLCCRDYESDPRADWPRCNTLCLADSQAGTYFYAGDHVRSPGCCCDRKKFPPGNPPIRIRFADDLGRACFASHTRFTALRSVGRFAKYFIQKGGAAIAISNYSLALEIVLVILSGFILFLSLHFRHCLRPGRSCRT